MTFDEGLAERMREVTPRTVYFSERKMFGGLCFMFQGNMACGVVDDKLMLRLSKELVTEYRKEPHTAKMDFTGKSMPTMMYVEAEGIAEDDQLRVWMERAIEFSKTLEPK